MDEQVTYKKPVYSGDTIMASVVLTEIKEYTDCYIGTLKGKCVYHQYMDKKFFELGE